MVDSGNTILCKYATTNFAPDFIIFNVIVFLLALQHVGSSQIKDRTCVSCISRWVLYRLATREALGVLISKMMISSFQILGLCCMVLTLALCVKCFYKHHFIYFSQTFYVLNDHVPLLHDCPQAVPL